MGDTGTPASRSEARRFNVCLRAQLLCGQTRRRSRPAMGPVSEPGGGVVKRLLVTSTVVAVVGTVCAFVPASVSATRSRVTPLSTIVWQPCSDPVLVDAHAQCAL